MDPPVTVRVPGWLASPVPAGSVTAPGHVTHRKLRGLIRRACGPVCREIAPTAECHGAVASCFASGSANARARGSHRATPARRQSGSGVLNGQRVADVIPPGTIHAQRPASDAFLVEARLFDDAP